jgi:hypothetical protein
MWMCLRFGPECNPGCLPYGPLAPKLPGPRKPSKSSQAMDDIDAFRTFYELADRIISESSKEDVAEAARLLALNVAHYQVKHGAPPGSGPSAGATGNHTYFRCNLNPSQRRACGGCFRYRPIADMAQEKRLPPELKPNLRG